MTKDVSPTDIQHYPLERILYSFQLNKNAPTVVFIAGIHGNEPAGILGLKQVIDQFKAQSIALIGNCYAIAGNLNALEKNVRFEKSDLNRLWNLENVVNLNENSDNPEIREQYDLYRVIKTIISKNQGPFYFIDLHTTSARSVPFITISDSLNNRKFAAHFSLPVILGIEEYLEGPLLTFINEFGHVSLGFEAGQHDDHNSINNCIVFILKALVISGCLAENQLNNFENFADSLSEGDNAEQFYEVVYKHSLKDGDDFKLKQRYENFDPVMKGKLLALHNGNQIKAHRRGQIFMPLYQKQGNDGFFIITRIPWVWLWISEIFRKLKLHGILRLLPGVQQDPSNEYTLIVNSRTAKFLATEIFHLFGYRKKIAKNKKLYFIRRDRKITKLL